MSGAGTGTEDRDWQRLDKWLWCARLRKTRADCARMVEAGAVRVNRQPVDKPHYRLRPGDVLTLALGDAERGVVRVWRVASLAARRGPPAEAQSLYEDLDAAAS
ncbi:RNA-binding S4 domain-containing protein [Roseomonas sp. CCTCC AB2023176]|uniref:RNA-binding S4 domain-containing protein n=1 Tax=Roseomonas sp. CCTCC AB2023176 TaxID=3342640 RepID=UPI0035DF7681